MTKILLPELDQEPLSGEKQDKIIHFSSIIFLFSACRKDKAQTFPILKKKKKSKATYVYINHHQQQQYQFHDRVWL